MAGVAILQPYLDVTAKNSELLVRNGTTWLQAVALALLVALVPPAVAFGIELLVGLPWPRVRPVAHAVLCGAFAVVLGIEVLKPRTDLGRSALVGTGIAVGVGIALLVWRVRVFRTFLRYLAIGCALFVPLFLFASPATAVLGSDSTATAAVHARTPHRVVLIVLDELPTMSLLDGSGHVDASLYPNLAALAGTSTWYRNNTTVAGFTPRAVPAILTGRYPHGLGALPTADEYPKNLFTMLGGTARMNVHEAVTRLCPKGVCSGQRSGLDDLVSSTSDLYRQFAAPSRPVFRFVDTDEARSSVGIGEDFVRSLRPGRGFEVGMVHLVLPHYPWERLPDLRRYDVPDVVPGESYAENPVGPGTATARVRHLLQVQAADTLVGRITDRLRRIGAFDDSLVVVTADHGVSLSPGETVRVAGFENVDEIMWAPLLVKYPGQRGAVIDERRSETVDIVPTILDVVGADAPWRLDGRSLRAAPADRPLRRFYPFYASKPGRRATGAKQYVEIEGTADYRRVLAATASPFPGDPRLRPYRLGPYGGLIGRETSTFAPVAGPPALVTLSDPERLRTDGDDPVPWVWNHAIVGPERPEWIAVASGGRIVAVAQTAARADGVGEFTFLLPPSLVRPPIGLEYFAVSGPPTAPVLATIS